MGVFDKTLGRERSHGHRSYNTPIMHDISFDPFFPYVNAPLSPHHIRTKPYSVPLKMYDLHEKARASSYLDSSISEYRLVYMIIDVAHHRLFGPPRIIDECNSKHLANSFTSNLKATELTLSTLPTSSTIKMNSPVFHLTLR
jgi:hypothetical protein